MATWWRKFIPSKNDRELRRLRATLAQINALEPKVAALTDAELAAETPRLKAAFAEAFRQLGGDPDRDQFEGTKDERRAERQRIDGALATILPQAFAVCREASKRVLGLRHYDTQMLGGMVLHEGKIAEMKTGEGKTLVATLPVYLNALAGRSVHVVTVNEYLAGRDARWMGRLYKFLQLDCGLIVSGLTDAQRQEAYRAPITYGTNSEFGFDFLRDNMKLFLRDYSQRGQHFAIVDEVDSILIDEARTPLIISGPSEESTDKYARINGAIPGLRREQDFTVDEKARTVVLTESGVRTMEKRLGVDNLYEPENIEVLHHVTQALRAHTLYRRDVDYMVEDGKVKIVDEFTGRVLEGRRWSDGLHQAVEAKEGVKIENENQTLATITYQNYFRNFLKLGGMTGTAETEAEEFAKIYDLDVVMVPTHRPMVRQDLDDVIYKTEREKFAAIVDEIKDRREGGQPILVGTISVEKSEILSRQLRALKIPHNVLNAKYHRQEAAIIAQAGRLGSVTIATNMAGRGTDILLGGNAEFMTREQLGMDETQVTPEAYEQALARCKEACEREKEAVVEAGGLHILGTERHESRRIDNQLRGRAGRQGDPGSSQFFISLEDDLMRIFGGERLAGMMERLGMKDGEVITHGMVNASIENAQRRVEGHNFDVRKHLLEYDDVMNDQRGAIYKLRRRVLGAGVEETRELVKDLLEDSIINLVARYCPERVDVSAWDLQGLARTASEQFAIAVAAGDGHEGRRDELELHLYNQLEAELLRREAQYGAEAFYHVTRILYLQTIDALWKDHLRQMDQLREGISLRGYAQKDPKQEYKKEGYNLFAATMATIGVDVLQKIYRVVITQETEEAYLARQAAMQERQRQLLAQNEAHARIVAQAQASAAAKAEQARRAQAAQAQASAAPQAPLRREGPKVGPNDPCPCGSGKKYKKCHQDAGAEEVAAAGAKL